ncbi:MAG: alpha-L-fucosidase [Acidimicrobiales bacterium]|nr:alpha-L-fucosidase [Acidimicrobiales bacterium]
MTKHDDKAIPGHRVPPWFEDAKLGIFIHWGIFSVPAWAPTLPPGQSMPDLLHDSPRELGARLPYAEWYANALRIPGSPTARHHAATYGDTPYEDFRATFEAGLVDWDPGAWADAFAATGAGYVVLVTKHHDGYLLWPSEVVNPRRPGWHAPRDLVGELAEAVRARGLRFGVYYSTGLDWTFEDLPIREPLDLFAAIPRDPAYAAYVDAHLRELVDRYRPSVVWADIGAPPGFDLRAFLTDYYAVVPDGTTNDRWQIPGAWVRNPTARRAANGLAAALLPKLPQRPLEPGTHPLADFRTPEYSSPGHATRHKWETTRGMGAAFGHNANEPDGHLVDPDELVRGLADVVAKNGNLLLNVGPDGHGRVTEREAVRLRALADWMAVGADALRGSRPWVRAEGRTGEGIDIRFTQSDGAIFALLLDTPEGGSKVTLPDLAAVGGRRFELLGRPGELAVERDDRGVPSFLWPAEAPERPVQAIKVAS